MVKRKEVILVDPSDRKIGKIEKLLAHQFAMLHRAFSVFIFRHRNNQWELLLQQRNMHKYHAGGLWTNTCCSHPHPGEKILSAAKKRLKEEMGIEADLREVGKFHYVALFKNGLVENEIDHVMVGIYEDDEIVFNPEEVQKHRWIKIETLLRQLSKKPSNYTPWFKQALELALKGIQQEEKR